MSSSQDNNVELRRIQDSIESYLSTIHAIEAFVSISTWDPKERTVRSGSRHSLGRVMHYVTVDQAADAGAITPDCVVQYSDELGFIVEVKRSLPRDRSLWLQEARQLEKYDSELMGWWTSDELISATCTVLLIHQSRSRAFCDWLETAIAKSELSLTSHVCVIEFNRSDEGRTFIFLRTMRGQVQETTIEARLHEGIQIPLDEVLATYGDLRFYDSQPDVEHTMQVMWTHLFTNMRTDLDIEYDSGQRCYPIPVAISDITAVLQRWYGNTGGGSREREFPLSTWIADALSAFERIGLARSEGDGRYTVLFRRVTGNLLGTLARHRRAKHRVARQLALPLDEPSVNTAESDGDVSSIEP